MPKLNVLTVMVLRVALLSAAWVIPANAYFIGPSYAPVDRLIANTESHLKENPRSHEAYYTLARIHYLAFVNRAGLVGVMKWDDPPKIAPDWLPGNFEHDARYHHARDLIAEEMGYASSEEVPAEKREALWNRAREKTSELERSRWEPEQTDHLTAFRHAAAAVLNFKKAIDLEPRNALYHLGLASLAVQYIERRETVPWQNEPSDLKALTLDVARKEFLLAHNLSIKKDAQLSSMPIEGLRSLVSHEAGKAFIKLAETAGVSLSEDEQRSLPSVKKSLRGLENLRRGVITPIIFSFKANSKLSDLLAPDVMVSFDLDGDERVERWPWVKPDTGILVWDPAQTGNITSGRQLFGSVTWWIFFENGYRALDALDDDRDGFLSEQELEGISVWFDKNSNGKSDRGEVYPVRSVGIQSLGTRPTGTDQDSPMHATGVVLSDGIRLPSFDWIVAPISSARNGDLR